MAATRPVLLAVLLATNLLAACRREPAAAGAKRYPLEGRVVAVDVLNRTLTLAHQDIPGFMPAMTMPFVLLERDAVLLRGISPGDSITATLVVPDSRYWIEDLVVVKPALPLPGATPGKLSREPEIGQLQPDVALIDQDGRALRLTSYRGRAVAITFVFTRCPMPDFCPFLMRSFAVAHAALVADPALVTRTALLTLSFDTVHDTPEVLRGFGRPFQRTSPPFTHWKLATGSLDAIRTLGEAVGLDFAPDAGSFTHNLRTAVVDPEGRLRRLLRGNDWQPAALVAELKAAAGG
jgi:protein SCO1/2